MVIISVCSWHLEASESKLVSLKLRDKSFVHCYQDSHKVVSGDVSYKVPEIVVEVCRETCYLGLDKCVRTY